MAPTPILIGVPAYNGQAFIKETLNSIACQEFANYQVVISVDGNDTGTAAACGEFLNDSRFRLVMQPKRLGWAANLNWLMNLGDYDFFCFWQQDDLASADYLSALHETIITHPGVACCYSDIQWFGIEDHVSSAPSLYGLAVNRTLAIIETLNGIPFRGLIRRQALERVGPVRLTEFESAFEEFIWVARLAREGPLHRVPGPIYFKRRYKGSTHDKWHDWPRERRRSVWIEFGLGVIDALQPALYGGDLDSVLGMVLERLCISRSGRFLFYDPAADIRAFAADFVEKAMQRYAFTSLEGLASNNLQHRSADSGVIIESGQDLVGIAASVLGLREGFRTRLFRKGRLELSFQHKSLAVLLLEDGWSCAEDWGVWSDGRNARLRLPIPARDGVWRAEFTCMAFRTHYGTQRVLVHLAHNSQVTEWILEPGLATKIELELGRATQDFMIKFKFPDAISPRELGESEDTRRLGLGLLAVTLSCEQ